MPLDYARVMALDIPPVEHSFSEKDTILYALGVGLGQDPVGAGELAFVYEEGLRALPTMACVLGHSPYWIRDLLPEIDWVKVVHGEQSFRLHEALPTAGTVIGTARILDLIDKGPGRGAVLAAERKLTDAATGAVLATVVHTAFCRGEGGFGGPARPGAPAHPIPDRAPDFVCDLSTRPEQALIYRLSGDTNPLHADPATARAAGFPRPILHGLATFGIAGHAVLRTLCGYDPGRLLGMGGRFSAPVFPGETVRTELWREDTLASFRLRVLERDVVAISNGHAEITT